MTVGLVRRLFRRIHGEQAAVRAHEACEADATARFYDTARIVTNGHPRSCIRVGANTHVRGELLLFGHGGRITVGDYCYIGEGARLWSAIDISVGDRTLIAHNVTIMDNLTHPLSATDRHEHFKAIVSTGHPKSLDLGERAVVIEKDAWIGCHCVVLRGVTIGAGAIIAAGSVVTRSIPAGVIAAGNPARPLRPESDH